MKYIPILLIFSFLLGTSCTQNDLDAGETSSVPWVLDTSQWGEYQHMQYENDRLILIGAREIRALSGEFLKTAWVLTKFDSTIEHYVLHEHVYYLLTKYSIYAIDTFTGDIIWRKLHYFSDPHDVEFAWSDGRMYTVANEQELYVWQTKTGELLWSITLPFSGFRRISLCDNIIIANHYADNESLQLSGIDAHTGDIIWTTPPANLQPDSYLEKECQIYVTNHLGDTLYMLDGHTGQVLWNYNGRIQTSMMLFEDGKVHILESKKISALDMPTGQLLWRTSSPIIRQIKQPIRSIGKDSIVLISRNTSQCIAADTGKELWIVNAEFLGAGANQFLSIRHSLNQISIRDIETGKIIEQTELGMDIGGYYTSREYPQKEYSSPREKVAYRAEENTAFFLENGLIYVWDTNSEVAPLDRVRLFIAQDNRTSAIMTLHLFQLNQPDNYIATGGSELANELLEGVLDEAEVAFATESYEDVLNILTALSRFDMNLWADMPRERVAYRYYMLATSSVNLGTSELEHNGNYQTLKQEYGDTEWASRIEELSTMQDAHQRTESYFPSPVAQLPQWIWSLPLLFTAFGSIMFYRRKWWDHAEQRHYSLKETGLTAVFVLLGQYWALWLFATDMASSEATALGRTLAVFTIMAAPFVNRWARKGKVDGESVFMFHWFTGAFLLLIIWFFADGI